MPQAIGQEVKPKVTPIGGDVTALVNAAPAQPTGRGSGAGPNTGAGGGAGGTVQNRSIAAPDTPPISLSDIATGALPYLGGAAGGVIGGIGGTVGGLGVGGVPGAVGGAALGGAAGESLNQLIDRLMGKAAPPTMGAAAGAIGEQALVQGGSELAGQALAAGLSKWFAPWLMRSSLKPSKTLANDMGADVPQVIRTMLDEKVNVTPKGLEKLGALLSATEDEVKAALAASNATVDALDVARRAVPTSEKFMAQVSPQADLKSIDDTVSSFLTHPQMPASGQLPIQQAQQMKTGTYRVLEGKYGEIGSAATEASKALARGLKEEIEAAVPAVGPLNARVGALLTAKQAMRNRLPVAANMNPIGFANAAPDRPFRFLAALVDRSPAVKSMIANGLWVQAGQTAKVDPNLIRAAVAAVMASQEPER